MSEEQLKQTEENQQEVKEVKEEKEKLIIPAGQLKSGRVWKVTQKQKSSLFVSDGTKPIRTTWEKKQEDRLKQKRMKELEKSMIDARIESKRMKRQRMEENKARKAQNEFKNAQVQVISNVGKLKKMSKKQLKNIKKTRIDKNGNVEYVNAYSK